MNENITATVANNTNYGASKKSPSKVQVFGMGAAVGSVVTLIAGFSIQGLRHLAKKKGKKRHHKKGIDEREMREAMEMAQDIMDEMEEDDEE